MNLLYIRIDSYHTASFPLTHWHTRNSAIPGKLTAKAHVVFLHTDKIYVVFKLTQGYGREHSLKCAFSKNCLFKFQNRRGKDLQRDIYVVPRGIELADLKSFSVCLYLVHSPDVQTYKS